MGKKILIIYICNCTEKGWGRLLAHYCKRSPRGEWGEGGLSYLISILSSREPISMVLLV